ncbi:hypothetical protein BKA81DRAFT_180609 [Phyllosticta paracitricarpa]|uniref:Uncharacterized protein n=2 Tax=Phyllosticta TaxID=121621 RepID=A0ABR1M8I4_9PEZI
MFCGSSSSSSPAVDRSNNLCQTARGPNASRCGNLLRASTLFFLSPLGAAGVASAATAGDGAGATCMYMHASRPGAQVTGLRWRRRRRGMVRSREGWERALMRVVGWLAGWRGLSFVPPDLPNAQAYIHIRTDTCQAEDWKRAVAEAVAREPRSQGRQGSAAATTTMRHIPHVTQTTHSSPLPLSFFCLSSPVQPDEAKEACRLLGACM